MNSISLAEARQNFPQLLEKVERGEGFAIVRDGRTIAKLVPQNAEKEVHGPESMTEEERKEAQRSLMALLNKGVHLGGLKIDRQELYDRDGMKIIA